MTATLTAPSRPSVARPAAAANVLEIDRATIRVLLRNRCEVVLVRGQICCGALNAHSGDHDGAVECRVRRQNSGTNRSLSMELSIKGCRAVLIQSRA